MAAHFQSKLAEIAELALIEQLGQPAAEKAKEAEIFTCRVYTGKYTDGSGSGSGSKKNYGFCSSKYRATKGKCEHGREKYKCKDCGTGHCEHGLWKSNCKDWGTARCDHGCIKNRCKDRGEYQHAQQLE